MSTIKSLQVFKDKYKEKLFDKLLKKLPESFPKKSREEISMEAVGVSWRNSLKYHLNNIFRTLVETYWNVFFFVKIL